MDPGTAQIGVFDDTDKIVSTLEYTSLDDAFFDMPLQMLLYNSSKIVMNYKSLDSEFLHCYKLEKRIYPKQKGLWEDLKTVWKSILKGNI